MGTLGLTTVFPALEGLTKGRVAAYRVFDIMDRENKIDSLSKEGEVMESCNGGILTRNILRL
jgi:hypothetical protein